VLQEFEPPTLQASRHGPTSTDASSARLDAPAAELTVVVPTRNERGNVAPLIARLEKASRELRLAILFVDDSTDDTPRLISEAGRGAARRVSVIHRPAGQRDGGLGGAVIRGLAAAGSEWVCVMDADLQHPPELLGALLEQAHRSGADVVVASRYCPGGDTGEFSALRKALSRGAGLVAGALFPFRLQGVSDPLSGFFLARRDAIDLDALQPRGFKILLEILVCGGPLVTSEVPFRFGARYAGDSKASLREGVRYLRRLLELRLTRPGGVWNRHGRTVDEHGPSKFDVPTKRYLSTQGD
jgi:dolichol-phosphate mannosyltransferase